MGMFGTSWRAGRIAGIELRIDSSWVVIALLITYSMYLRLSVLYPELQGGGAVGLAILSAGLFFGAGRSGWARCGPGRPVGGVVLRLGAGPRTGPRAGLGGKGDPRPGHHPVLV